LVRKGRITLQIVIPEAQIETAKTNIIDNLKNLRDQGIIESAQGQLTYEELPETITV